MTKTLKSRTTAIIGTYHLATEPERIHGRRWYEQAHTAAIDFSLEFQLGFIPTAGVIAALSPNNRWSRNLMDAAHLMEAFCEHGPVVAERVKVATFNANKAKALTILKLTSPTIDDVCNVLNGRKVSAFYRCILGDQQSVCVDGHAYSIWAGEPISTTKTPSISKGLYEQITADYRAAAALINEHDGHVQQLTPAQLQAITWVAHRRLKGLKDGRAGRL